MAMSALGKSYDRLQNLPRNHEDDFKRPPLPSESSNYRIRHAYKNPYLSKDSPPYAFRRSNSCAADNRYNLRNSYSSGVDRMTESAGDNDFSSSYKSYPNSYRNISSAQSLSRENRNFERKNDFSKFSNEESFTRISSYDNLFSRINEIEKQVKELKGHEATPLNSTENNFYRKKYEPYRTEVQKSSGDQEIERLNSLLKHEIQKSQRLAEENERLRKDLLKSEGEVTRLKETNKKNTKKVSFVEKPSSWREKFQEPTTTKYSQLYEDRQSQNFNNYEYFDNKYGNNENCTNPYKPSPVSTEDKFRDYSSYKNNFSYENYLNKDKNMTETSSQFSNCTDAILQNADAILKENNDFFTKIQKDQYYTQPSYNRSYNEPAPSKPSSKKRLITPRTISDLKMGDIVKFERQDGKFACGFVRYKGPIEGKNGSFVGLELEHDNGKNDGSLENKRYFYCKHNHGLFIQFDKILVAWTD